eukprot:6181527-Prymnesium_polylepis.2
MAHPAVMWRASPRAGPSRVRTGGTCQRKAQAQTNRDFARTYCGAGEKCRSFCGPWRGRLQIVMYVGAPKSVPYGIYRYGFKRTR